LSGALVWQSMQSRVVPYVVEVDNLGQAQAITPAAKDYRPTDPQIAWFLSKFINDVRGRSLDPVLMRANWLSAYDFATERASLFLGEYARTANPFADVGRKTVSVQVTSVVRASDNSFRVGWTEQQYERGSLASTSRWTAMLTVKLQPPRSADVLRKNPLGLYVDAIDWSRELETLADRPATGPTASPATSLPAPVPPAGIPSGSSLDPTLAPPDAAPIPERNAQ
jgi:type IV secretion system protein VirB5